MEYGDKNLVVVIMAGGMGTRLWPLSTKEKPKQFLRFFDDRSLLQKNLDRLSGIVPPDRIIILTNACYTGLVKEQVPEIPAQNIIGEPIRKDTAAAVCLGTLISIKRFNDPVIVTLTADHLIEPPDLFQHTILSAVKMARQTKALYTFGIKPTYASTGYGYLETGENFYYDEGIEHFRLKSFKEKPDKETARQYIESGQYLWNSGMFVWTAESILRELKLNLPDHIYHLTKALDKEGTTEWEDMLRNEFSKLERISIDYSIMEKARDVRCVAGTFLWKDVGSWTALEEYIPRDKEGNCIKGYDVKALDASNNLIFCEESDEKLAMVGVRDMVIVRAGPKTLIAHKDRLDDIKKIVESMK